MKTSLGICAVFCCAIFGLGSAIRCFKCKDYTGSCSKTQDCSYEDACLTLTERGGDTYRQCIKYSDCDFKRLAQMFPHVASSFNFNCCTNNLCNGAVSRTAGMSLLGLLPSLAVVWWCMH